MKLTNLNTVGLSILTIGVLAFTGCNNSSNSNNEINTKQIAAAWYNTAAVKNDGTLWSWGYNGYGQVGNDDTEDVDAPIKIGTDTDWKSVSAYGSHTLALKSNGALWAWGYNEYGEVGNDDTVDVLSPIKIGTKSWRDIAAGYYQSVAIKDDGTLWSWGSNEYGVLGNDNTSYTVLVPTKISDNTNWKSIESCYYNSYAIKKDGTLWGWGSNDYGQLGDVSAIDTDVLVPTKLNDDTDWKSVSCDDETMMAIKDNETLWGMGYNGYGNLGNNSDVDVHELTQIGTGWQSVEVGYYHTSAVKADGTLWVWGYLDYGEAGDGNTYGYQLVPLQSGSDSDWITSVASYYNTFGVKNDGALYSSGYNYYGSLGVGHVSEVDIFTQVLSLD